MDDRMEQHFNVIAYLNFAYGALIAAIALLIGSIFSFVGRMAASEMPADAAQLLGSVGGIVSLALVALSVPYFLAGYAVLKRYSWGRILAIILGALALLSFPVGTALGAYTLWALTRPEAENAFF